MTDSICLTTEELFDLTRYKRPSAQARALNHMGIDHRIRLDGSVVVFRYSLPGYLEKTTRSSQGGQLDIDALLKHLEDGQ